VLTVGRQLASHRMHCLSLVRLSAEAYMHQACPLCCNSRNACMCCVFVYVLLWAAVPSLLLSLAQDVCLLAFLFVGRLARVSCSSHPLLMLHGWRVRRLLRLPSLSCHDILYWCSAGMQHAPACTLQHVARQRCTRTCTDWHHCIESTLALCVYLRPCP
jgi:hypothetical protein